MNPLVTSSLISAGSSLLGGALGGGEKRPRYRDALNAQMWATKNDIDVKMQKAKEHGIHPLMMLGVGSASAPTPHIASSGSMGPALANAGADISRAVSSGQSSNLERLQERLLSAQIEGQEIDNVSRASQIARTNSAGSPPLASTSGRIQIMPKEVVSNTGTIEDGTRAIAQRFKFLDTPIYGMSEDYANAGNDEGPMNWLSGIAQIAQMAAAIPGYGLRQLRKRAQSRPSKQYTRNPYRN